MWILNVDLGKIYKMKCNNESGSNIDYHLPSVHLVVVSRIISMLDVPGNLWIGLRTALN